MHIRETYDKVVGWLLGIRESQRIACTSIEEHQYYSYDAGRSLGQRIVRLITFGRSGR